MSEDNIRNAHSSPKRETHPSAPFASRPADFGLSPQADVTQPQASVALALRVVTREDDSEARP